MEKENKKEKFPQPPPDRRLNRKSSQPQMNPYTQNQQNNEKFSNNKNYTSNSNARNQKNTIEKYENYDESYSNMDLIKQKNIEDLRKQINQFKILSDKKMFLNYNYSNIHLNFANFVLFGPSGSGKSSFIRTLFKSLYSTKNLSPDLIDKLIIKSEFENEGTLKFLRMTLKEHTEESTGIRICDTRGHILMNKEEKEQFKLIVEGKVKDNVQVVQSNSRNPLLLWEFWKKDETIFSDDILLKDNPSLEVIPHTVILVFDGSSEDIINPEDVEFYRDLVSISIARAYTDIHVILTRVDILEEMAYKRKNQQSKDDIQNLIHSIKDQQIEKVIESLGVKRSNVHFIENYLSEKYDNNIEIDYHVLKTLSDMINSCEQFLLMHFNKNTTCFSKCM